MGGADLFKKPNSDDILNRCDAIEELSKDISAIGAAEEIQKHFDDNYFLVRSETYGDGSHTFHIHKWNLSIGKAIRK